MNKIKVIVLFFWIFSSLSFAQHSWTRLTDFPSKRFHAASFSIGEKGYVYGGLSPQGRNNDLWEYNSLTKEWLQKSSMPSFGREGAIGFSIGGKGYVCGGVATNQPSNELWEYDPIKDKWKKLASIPVSEVTQNSMRGFCLNDKIYIRAAFNIDDFWEYNPQDNQWRKKTNYPGDEVAGLVGFSIGDKGYLGTGFNDDDASSKIYEYNHKTDKWTRKADYPGQKRFEAVSFSINGFGYLGLGVGDGNYPKDFWKYSPAEDKWYQIDSCGYGVIGAFAFNIGDFGYVGCGVFTEGGDFWCYNSKITSIEKPATEIPEKVVLNQNYPNPFNPVSTISYSIPEEGIVSLKIYNLLGREVKKLVDENQSAGDYSIKFDASNLPSGIYIYTLKTCGISRSKKMLLIK